jgi:biopolymer transport protein ExbD
MQIKTKRKKRIDIAESGALSDLAFLLIIFFIVIAVFTVNTGFILGLPRKDSTKIVNVEDLIKITLLEDGTLEEAGRPLSLSELDSLVTQRLSVRPNMTLLLRIHPDVPYQEVVDLIEFVREKDVDNFSFRMMEADAGKPAGAES